MRTLEVSAGDNIAVIPVVEDLDGFFDTFDERIVETATATSDVALVPILKPLSGVPHLLSNFNSNGTGSFNYSFERRDIKETQILNPRLIDLATEMRDRTNKNFRRISYLEDNYFVIAPAAAASKDSDEVVDLDIDYGFAIPGSLLLEALQEDEVAAETIDIGPLEPAFEVYFEREIGGFLLKLLEDQEPVEDEDIAAA